MPIDYSTLATQGIQGLQPYQPGKPIEELARELGLDPARVVKLASNENPLGPSEKALQAISSALPELCRYPDGSGFALKKKLAARYGVDPLQLTLGNGSNDILEFAARAFVTVGDEVIYSQHAFAVYPIVTQALGARHVKVPALHWGHDLDAMADAVTERTRLIFIANPNNPTGTMVGQDALRRFLQRVPETVMVILDEAYFEYIDTDDYPNGLDLLSRHPNLIVTRTFSKAWGLAALRVGYAFSSIAVADLINRVRQPFNVSTLGLAAASAVLDDNDYLERSRQINREGIEQLTKGFERLGLSWVPTQCNFVAVDLREPATHIYEALLKEGVIVRPIGGGYEMPNHLRISVGLAHENAQCLTALEHVLMTYSKASDR